MLIKLNVLFYIVEKYGNRSFISMMHFFNVGHDQMFRGDGKADGVG